MGSDTPVGSGRPLQVLVIEDSELDAELVLGELRRSGFTPSMSRVESAGSLREALVKQDWDVVISDYSMPGFDGLAGFQIVKDHDEDLPFILVSGTVGEERAVQAMKAGVHDYILKGNLRRLGPAVRREIQESRMRRSRREAQDDLLRSEERLRALVAETAEERRFLAALLDTLEPGILACDRHGRLTLMNPAARALCGLSASDPLPPEVELPLLAVEGSAPVAAATRPLAKVLSGADVHGEELLVGPPGRLRRVIVSGHAMRDPDGRRLGAVVALHDVTENRRLEEELRQSQKVEAMGRLAAGVAHDFNNILTIVLGYTDLALMDVGMDGTLRGELEEVRRAAERAADLTRQLLAFSRRQAADPRILDLNTVLRDLARMLPRLLGPDVELRLSLDPALPGLRADRGQLEQVVMNLAVNARDAMPRGGVLLISTAVEAREGEEKTLRLTVTDSGLGIPKEALARIYEPFFTTKESGKGTGLGLAIVHGVVSQLGGSIEVESVVGKGTAFRLHLPATSDAAESVPEEAAHPAGGAVTETILVVDDEDPIRSFVRLTLEKAGYRVLSFPNGPEGYAAALAYGPERIALLVTDTVMPGMSGRVGSPGTELEFAL